MRLTNEEIKAILPHRYPFLLVDRIESIEEETKTIVGIKCVSANEMQFLGHFPQKKRDARRLDRRSHGTDRCSSIIKRSRQCRKTSSVCRNQ